MDGTIVSGASIVLYGKLEGVNLFTDLGIVTNGVGSMFSWGFGIGYNKINVNMEKQKSLLILF